METQILSEKFSLSASTIQMVEEREQELASVYQQMKKVAFYNQAKVLAAFSDLQIGQGHFFGSTGYGYDDMARDTLEKLFARIFDGEDALVRPHIASGTHAIYIALRGLLSPGDTLYYISGTPYDTLHKAIGIVPQRGSLLDRGITYKEEPLVDNQINVNQVVRALQRDRNIKVVAVQRSAGYASRAAVSLADMKQAFSLIRTIRPDVMIFVDNCYGEFCCIEEPTSIGAHVIAGSLIKNPGGGIAPCGGYLIGTKESIASIEGSVTIPGVGREIGSYEASYRPYYQGLFQAPSTVLAAKKTASLFSAVFHRMGYHVNPLPSDRREDIIQMIGLGSKERLIAFCQTIQAFSPVDSFATPIPWEMPGYQDPVIMAAGTFVGGASIELSVDGPMRDPYSAFLQGSLAYEHGKLACMGTVDAIKRVGE